MSNELSSNGAAPAASATIETRKIVASDGNPNAWFGTSVALFGDIAVVGAPNATVNGQASQGAAYIFKRTAGLWKQIQKLVASDGAPGDQFGQAAALFNGKTIVITAPLATINGNRWAGAAYVYNLAGNSWIQKQKLVPTDSTANGTFGKCVALNPDHILIGAGGASSGGVHIRGSMYAYRFTPDSKGGTWTQIQRIPAPDPADDTAFFASSVAISGNTALIGAYSATVSGNLGQGTVYAYNFLDIIWSMSATLTASDGAPRDNFGISIGFQGSTAFIGAPGATVKGNVSQGTVYRFDVDGTQWTQASEKLIASDGTATNLFGASVSFANSRVLVGAYASNDYRGAAYVFGPLTDGIWAQRRKLIAHDGQPHDVFGYHTALDTNTAIVSAYGADIGDNARQGAAYLYDLRFVGP